MVQLIQLDILFLKGNTNYLVDVLNGQQKYDLKQRDFL